MVEEDLEVALLGLLLVGCGEAVGAAEDRGRLSLAFSLHSPPPPPGWEDLMGSASVRPRMRLSACSRMLRVARWQANCQLASASSRLGRPTWR